MRRRIQYAILVALIGLITLPTLTKAQKIGLSVIYGEKIENIGGRIDAQYRFHEYFRITGDFSVYLTKEYSNQSGEWNWWSVNTNLDFIFLDIGLFRTYALAGINYANIMRTYPTSGITNVDSQIGANAGGGLEYKTNFGTIYSEFRYGLIKEKFQQYEINAGVRFYIGGGR